MTRQEIIDRVESTNPKTADKLPGGGFGEDRLPNMAAAFKAAAERSR